MIKHIKQLGIRAVYIKIGNKQVFINKYTKKIPVVRNPINRIESILLTKNAQYERQKEYESWIEANYPSPASLSRQRKAQSNFTKKPLMSVLVPTYKTNLEHLKQCFDSVINQTYANWELCVADDASPGSQIRELLEEYSKKDKRIKYVIRDKNGHICKATNSALKIAKGEYVALLDHDDVLWPNALFEVVKRINQFEDVEFIYSDEDKLDLSGKHVDPFFKPDWSPEFLRSVNYITHFAVIKKSLVEKMGGFRPGYEGAQDWDLFLRISRAAKRIEHIPTILYSWRKSEESTAHKPSAKNYAYTNQKRALLDDIQARGYEAKVEWEIPYSMWRVQYKIKKNPLVSIIIPTKDQYEFIERCLRTVYERTSYRNVEIVVVDTGSSDDRVWELYEQYGKKFVNMKLLKWEEKFNFASVCNYGAKEASGEYYLFLNNDTEVITESWVEDMLAYAQQKNIGAVGAKLYYPNGKLQHGGIILGVGGQNGTPGIAGHYFPAFSVNPLQDPAMLTYVGGTRNFTAVTAACVMVSASKFNKVKGFDPKYRIAFNDVDLCLKLFSYGWRNVYLPHVELYHYESISVGQPGSKVRDIDEFSKEINMMLKSWKQLIEHDPFYHPEFRRDVASARLDQSKYTLKKK